MDPSAKEVPKTVGQPKIETGAAKIVCDNVNVYYGDKHAIIDVSVDIGDKEVTAFIGPSGCGKSTLLRCLNRMNDTIKGCRVAGDIVMGQQDIYNNRYDPVLLRARVGMVFQKPNPFPKSIYDNVAYGPRIHGLVQSKADTDDMVETSLKKAGLWDEVKDSLRQPGISLSGGQQQRLCIARTISVGPEIVLMDEPCSALGPIATAKIEDLIDEMKQNYTIAIVTHSIATRGKVAHPSLTSPTRRWLPGKSTGCVSVSVAVTPITDRVPTPASERGWRSWARMTPTSGPPPPV